MAASFLAERRPWAHQAALEARQVASWATVEHPLLVLMASTASVVRRQEAAWACQVAASTPGRQEGHHLPYLRQEASRVACRLLNCLGPSPSY